MFIYTYNLHLRDICVAKCFFLFLIPYLGIFKRPLPTPMFFIILDFILKPVQNFENVPPPVSTKSFSGSRKITYQYVICTLPILAKSYTGILEFGNAYILIMLIFFVDTLKSFTGTEKSVYRY